MTGRHYFSFDGDSVFSHIEQCAPAPRKSPTPDPFYVYVMGPYTAFDASYPFPDADKLESPFIDDPLFDPKTHLNKIGRHSYEAALVDVCESIRSEFGAYAYLATDVRTIPTIQEATGKNPGMSVLDQTVAFAAASDAVIFILTDAGLTTGTGSEIGAVLSDFNLRRDNPEPDRKPRKRIGIFQHQDFKSASISEIPYTYDVSIRDFNSKEDLLNRIQHFIEGIRREANARPLPIYRPYR